MKSGRLTRHAAGCAALVTIAASGALTVACGNEHKDHPSTSSTTTTTAATTASTTAAPTSPPTPVPTTNMPNPTSPAVFTPQLPAPPQTTHRQRDYQYPGAGPG
jgi:type IV secretory pathway VirB10-like protein